jgi:hypothetical protein
LSSTWSSLLVDLSQRAPTIVPELGGWPFTVTVPETSAAWMSASSVVELVSDTPLRTTRRVLPAPSRPAGKVGGA